MSFGRKLKDGFLPVYSVGSEAEAHRLIVLTCPRNPDGTYYSRELALARQGHLSPEEELASLKPFSERLDRAHDHLVAHGQCTCLRIQK